MNSIGFSHRYAKMHGQTTGILVSALPFLFARELVGEETYMYDTDGVFDLEDGRYLQLVFIGDKEIPFTTYRKDNAENRERFCGHLREYFAFNFKGENKK